MTKKLFNETVDHINFIRYCMNDSNQDGYMSWEYKKQLIDLKFLIDEILSESPKFSIEEPYIEEKRFDMAAKKLGANID